MSRALCQLAHGMNARKRTARTAVEPLGQRPGGDVGRSQLQHGGAAGLEGVDAQLELRAQQAPQVEHHTPVAVQARGMQLPVIVLPPLRAASHLRNASLGLTTVLPLPASSKLPNHACMVSINDLPRVRITSPVIS